MVGLVGHNPVLAQCPESLLSHTISSMWAELRADELRGWDQLLLSLQRHGAPYGMNPARFYCLICNASSDMEYGPPGGVAAGSGTSTGEDEGEVRIQYFHSILTILNTTSKACLRAISGLEFSDTTGTHLATLPWNAPSTLVPAPAPAPLTHYAPTIPPMTAQAPPPIHYTPNIPPTTVHAPAPHTLYPPCEDLFVGWEALHPSCEDLFVGWEIDPGSHGMSQNLPQIQQPGAPPDANTRFSCANDIVGR
jgi:hypothetical protein